MLDIPSKYRDTAVWIGPTGVGKPSLSDWQRELKARQDADRRLIDAEAEMIKMGKPPADRPIVGAAPGPSQPLAVQCIANVQKIMTSPGVWKSGGPCYSGPTTEIPTIRWTHHGASPAFVTCWIKHRDLPSPEDVERLSLTDGPSDRH